MMHKWGLWSEAKNRVIERAIKKPDTPAKEGEKWLPLIQEVRPPFDEETEELQVTYTNDGKDLRISYSKFNKLEKVTPTLYKKEIRI